MSVRSLQGAHVRRFALLYFAVFVVFWGQMALNPLIAPLAREVGMAEWQAGAMISTAAVVVVLTSGAWGRTSQRWGRKPVLVTALLVAAAASACFAVLAATGMRGVLTGAVLVGLLVLVRGLFFGLAIAAVPPTAQAYVADATTTESERVAAMSGIGAAQGMAMILGSAAGGLLGGFGLLVPMAVIPVVLLLGAVVLQRRLPAQEAHELVADPVRVRVRDPRVWPFLVVGFGAFTSLGFIQILFGFLVADRAEVSTEATAALAGVMLVVAGVGMLVAQVVVVPRSGWGARTLLRVGPVVAAVGLAVTAIDGPLVLLGCGAFLTALGLGILIPGYTTGPTLLLRREEQGGVAGLIAANNAATFVVAPLAGTALYGLWAPAPILLALGVMLLVVVFVAVHPALRRVPETPAPAPATVEP